MNPGVWLLRSDEGGPWLRLNVSPLTKRLTHSCEALQRARARNQSRTDELVFHARAEVR